MSDSRSDETRAKEARKRQLEQKIQRQLDEALEASFPASDPVSIVTSHDEEDWGTDPAPVVPAKPPPHSGS
jgi:2-methylcitrate dehydratase PrpD